MTPHLRIARPVTDLERAVRSYREGLGLRELGRFADHDGFDGVMLGEPGGAWHLEFTRCRHNAIVPSPTEEDLLVFYLPEEPRWQAAIARALAAGWVQVLSHNPYWERDGRTFVDADGYRIVLQNAGWRG